MHRIRKYKFLFLIIITSFYNVSISDAQLFNYENYSVDNGFPQSNADYITQDKEGYLWFATQNGAVKFNGFNYKIYNNKNGLKNNIVSHIMQDKKGRIWISTKNGLSKLEKGKFKTFTKEEGLFSNFILRTFELNDGRIIISTLKGTNIFDDGVILKISKKIHPIQFLIKQNGDILALGNRKIYKFKDNNFTEIPKIYNNIVKPMTSFAEDKKGNIWISSRNFGIYKISPDFTIQNFTLKNGLLNNNINNVLIDSDDNLWYSSEQAGCGFLKDNKFNNITAKNGLTNTAVLSIFEDNEKNIWIGGRNGATMLNTRIPFIHYDKISTFENEIVMGMKLDMDSNIWFCTYGFGLTKFDGKKYTYYNKDNGTIDNHFFDVETDKFGNLWFASGNNGIIKYNGKTFSKIKTSSGEEIPKRILTIYKDSKNNLWFGTNGRGVYLYDGTNVKQFGKEIGLYAKDIMTFCEDNENNIWIGTINEGLFKYNGKNVTKINTNIEKGYYRTIINRKGTLWMGTGSNGVFKITKENGKYVFKQFQKIDGLSSDNIYLLFSDTEGNLWCGSEKGVDKLIFNKNDELIDIKNYTKDEGFIGIETNINAALEDKNGDIWFGTVNGAAKYNKSADKTNTIKNKIYISSIRLFFKKTNWHIYTDSVNYKNIPQNLVLPYNDNHLSINYIGLCFSNPKSVKYSYRLIGQNDNWSPPSTGKTAVFSNITPGKYQFQVISANNDNIWNIVPATFSFEIKAPFWKETWFTTLMLFILIVITFSIFELRTRSLKKAKRKLENEVNERTRELKTQKEELKEQKEELQTSNDKITDSINYAGKIQDAMFPSLQIFRNNFQEFNLFYKPKDILSGDFYWAKEYKSKGEHHVVVVAADCTGHGIPGALVSMLGISMLTEIVSNKKITQPSQVLEELRKEIKVLLKQKGRLEERDEGIEMAICALNKKTNEFEYSGAINPLYIVRNKEIIVLQPTFNPVGVFIKEIPFKNIKFQLQKDDIVYMFSDGYVDQFNGKTGKKFKIKRFQELLIEISDKDMDEQQQIIEETFYNWKANSLQIDDILILGFKI